MSILMIVLWIMLAILISILIWVLYEINAPLLIIIQKELGLKLIRKRPKGDKFKMLALFRLKGTGIIGGSRMTHDK